MSASLDGVEGKNRSEVELEAREKSRPLRGRL